MAGIGSRDLLGGRDAETCREGAIAVDGSEFLRMDATDQVGCLLASHTWIQPCGPRTDGVVKDIAQQAPVRSGQRDALGPCVMA